MPRRSVERNCLPVRPAALLLTLIGCILLTGCGKPRTLEDIKEEQRNLPGVYLTAETGKEVTAPSNTPVFVDEATGELCFPAYTCANPDCPGEGKGNRPYLFVCRRMLMEAGPDGEVINVEPPPGMEYREFILSRGGFLEQTCPACYKKRKPNTENAQQKQQYIDWVQPYEDPEVVKRRQELEEEYQSLFKG